MGWAEKVLERELGEREVKVCKVHVRVASLKELYQMGFTNCPNKIYSRQSIFEILNVNEKERSLSFYVLE